MCWKHKFQPGSLWDSSVNLPPLWKKIFSLPPPHYVLTNFPFRKGLSLSFHSPAFFKSLWWWTLSEAVWRSKYAVSARHTQIPICSICLADILKELQQTGKTFARSMLILLQHIIYVHMTNSILYYRIYQLAGNWTHQFAIPWITSRSVFKIGIMLTKFQSSGTKSNLSDSYILLLLVLYFNIWLPSGLLSKYPLVLVIHYGSIHCLVQLIYLML